MCFMHFISVALTCVAQDDPKLWYGIGILYDRYGSLDHAEEAFASVLRMNKGSVCFTCCVNPLLMCLEI